MCSSTNTGTNPLNRCYLNADPDPTKNPIGRNASLLAQLTVSWSTLLFDTKNRNDLLNDQLEIYRRGVAGEARPPCCPAPFDRENNWMHEFPSAYVIPLGAGQRSDAEANRLVDWLLFNGIEVRQLRSDSVILGQDVAAGSYVVDMNGVKAGPRLRVPMLYLAATADDNAGFDFSKDAETLFAKTAVKDKRLELLPGTAHGIGLVASSAKAKSLIEAFLRGH